MEASSNHLRSYIRRICAEAAAPSDALLWDRFVSLNDQNAFEVLVHRHGSMVLACAQRVLSDRSEAEDVFQATFLSLARAKQKLRHPEAMTSWLYQTAFRIAKKCRSKLPSTEESTLENVASANQESDLAWREVRGVLDEELQRLPDDLRSPMLLCYLNGLTRDEAAKQLGCSFDQLKRRLEKGRDSLRLRLEKRGIVGAALALAIISPEMLSANVSPALLEKIMAWVRGDGTVPQTVALLLASANTLSKGVVMKSLVAATLCVGAGVWGFANIGGGVEPQEKEKPPVVNPAKPAPKDPWPALEPYESPGEETRKCMGQQSFTSLNNLKIIMLAVHNHHDTYGYLPTDILDKDGKPLLSWRVALLPFLENGVLYNEFKLDQPWDSVHNAKLLAKMPKVFRLQFEPKSSMNTYYQAFSGTGTPFQTIELDADALKANKNGKDAVGGEGTAGSAGSGDTLGGDGSTAATTPKEIQPPKPGAKKRFAKPSIASVTDGLSNTFGVVEAGPPVQWTKPGGIPFDAKKPLPKLNGPFSNVLHVGMMDGSVNALKRGISDGNLRLCVSMNDGKASPDLKSLRAEMPAETPAEKADLRTQIQENLQRLKRLIELRERERDLMADLIQSSTSQVETSEIKAELQRREIRLKDEIKVLEAMLAGKKNPPAKSSDATQPYNPKRE